MCTCGYIIYACTAAGETSGGTGVEPPPGAIVIVSGRKLPDASYTHLPIYIYTVYTFYTIILYYTI